MRGTVESHHTSTGHWPLFSTTHRQAAVALDVTESWAAYDGLRPERRAAGQSWAR